MYELLFPFSQESRKIVSKLNLDVNNPKDEDLNYLYNVFLAIMNNDKMSLKVLLDLDQKYILYPYFRIVLSIINLNNFYSKYSQFYSDLCRLYVDLHEDEFLQILGIDFDFENGFYKIPYTSYTFAQTKSDKDKLVNKSLVLGYVYLQKVEVQEFICNFLSSKVLEGLPLNVKEVSKKFYLLANRIKKENTKSFKIDFKGAPIDVHRFAPCMQKIILELSESSANHMARYHLATYLYSIGMQTPQILEIFSKSQNFKEDVTMYQLEKIKGYSSANCDTIKGLGLCSEIDFCKKIKSPFEFYLKFKK